jgi:hypothetical protein
MQVLEAQEITPLPKQAWVVVKRDETTNIPPSLCQVMPS